MTRAFSATASPATTGGSCAGACTTVAHTGAWTLAKSSTPGNGAIAVHPRRGAARDLVAQPGGLGRPMGFLDVKISGLPEALQQQIDASIDVAEKSGF